MQRMTQAVLMTGVGWLALATASQAITPTGFMPGAENTVANAYNAVVGVWIPAISFAALMGLVLNLFFAWVRIGIKVFGLLIGVFLFGAGLPWLQQISGGMIATSFVLHGVGG